MDEEDEDELITSDVKQEEGRNKNGPKCSFILVSSLHKVPVPDEIWPYDVVELKDDEFQRLHEGSSIDDQILKEQDSYNDYRIVINGTEDHSWHLSDVNYRTPSSGIDDPSEHPSDVSIFARFGYDDLPDIDSSDDDGTDINPHLITNNAVHTSDTTVHQARLNTFGRVMVLNKNVKIQNFKQLPKKHELVDNYSLNDIDETRQESANAFLEVTNNLTLTEHDSGEAQTGNNSSKAKLHNDEAMYYSNDHTPTMSKHLIEKHISDDIESFKVFCTNDEHPAQTNIQQSETSCIFEQNSSDLSDVSSGNEEVIHSLNLLQSYSEKESQKLNNSENKECDVAHNIRNKLTTDVENSKNMDALLPDKQCDSHNDDISILTTEEPLKETFTITDKDDYQEYRKNEHGVVKRTKLYHQNIKTSREDHLSRNPKTKKAIIKKEYDNSIQLFHDLCLIVSTKPDSQITEKKRKDGKHDTFEYHNEDPPLSKNISASLMSASRDTYNGDSCEELENSSYHRAIIERDKLRNYQDSDSSSYLTTTIDPEAIQIQIRDSDSASFERGTHEPDVFNNIECDTNVGSEQNPYQYNKDELGNNPFAISHFGKNESATDHKQNESIYNPNSFTARRFTNTREEDIHSMCTRRCNELEESRKQQNPQQKEKTKEEKTENRPFKVNNWQGFSTHSGLDNWNSKEIPFEVRANQLWSSHISKSPSKNTNESISSDLGLYSSHQTSLKGHNWTSNQILGNTFSAHHSQSYDQDHGQSFKNPLTLNQGYDPYPSSQTLANTEYVSLYQSEHEPNISQENRKHNQALSSYSYTAHSRKQNQPLTSHSTSKYKTDFRTRRRSSWMDSYHAKEGECKCSRCTLNEYLSQLTDYMESIGFDLKNVSGDGNCLFAAIVDQLRINGDFSYNVDSLRQKSVQYLRRTPHVEDKTHLESFLTNETWDEYLRRMELDGEWGDDIILRGISELTGRKIVVYSSYMSITTLTPTTIFEKDELYIGHIQSLMHFVSLRPKWWDVLWPGRAMIRRHRQMIDDVQLSGTLYKSSIELATEKIRQLKENLNNTNLDNCNRLFGEIDDILKESTSHSIATPATHDTKETMDCLIQERFKVDELSGIPMLHLSYLVKNLIKPRYFISKGEDLRRIFDGSKGIFEVIGNGSLGLNARLVDFTAAMQHFTILERKTPKKIEPYPLTLVIKMERQKYAIKDRTQEYSVFSDHDLFIDDTDTFAGYIHLRPSNTAYWSGCVEWVSCQEAFLRSLPQKTQRDHQFEQYTDLSLKKLEGLDCNFWPRQAFKWTKRSPPSGWPSKEMIKRVTECGCLIIRRSHEYSENPDIEWQYVFSDAEKRLVQSFTDAMLYCFRVFRILVEHHTTTLKVKLKTYWLLTTMFYCSEIIPHHSWSANPGGCIMFLFAWLLKQIHEKDIPHYFIPENNIIAHLDEENLKSIEYNLQSLRWFPLASIYFLLESHSFLNLSLIDQVESSIKDYKIAKNKHMEIETSFVPLSFKLARRLIRNKLIPFYKEALEHIEEAYEQTISVQDEDNNLTFEDFILRFLSTFRDDDIQTLFLQLVDKVKSTHLTPVMLRNKATRAISEILGPEYNGDWRNVHIDVTDDKWNSIYELTGQLFLSNELEDCAEILRCSIHILQQELQEDYAEFNEINDSSIRRQIQTSRHKHVYFTLRYLVTYYKHLYMCYDSLDRVELFQEHIHEYEEIAGRIESPIHYQTLAKIYRQLGNVQKAQELEEKTKSIEPNDKKTALIVLRLNNL